MSCGRAGTKRGRKATSAGKCGVVAILKGFENFAGNDAGAGGEARHGLEGRRAGRDIALLVAGYA